MSNLSGYDSDSIGFDSITRKRNAEANSAAQTTEFSTGGTGSQTAPTVSHGCSAQPSDFESTDKVPGYPPAGLNEFLRRVVPAMIEQLDNNDKDVQCDTSDSDEEEVLGVKFFQSIKANDGSSPLGGGDQQPAVVLSVSWSSAGNSLAVSLGRSQHENWCEHEGLIRVYTVKRSENDKLVHAMDITEKNCITVVKYHPMVAALLAYGTTSGEVVLCNLRNVTSGVFDEGTQLASPSGFHSANRVTSMHWADAPLANAFLMMYILATGKRRGAADQILITSGTDGSVNVWQVNAGQQIFQNVISYRINGSNNAPGPDISCFDFIKSCPLRPPEEKTPQEIFAVGSVSGKLYLCNLKNYKSVADSSVVDPVYEELEGHSTCVLDLAFSFQRPNIFASISMDSELRVYDISQSAPMKVICMDDSLSCMVWIPNNPWLLVVGLAQVDKHRQLMKVYNISSGETLTMDGLTDADERAGVTITAMAVYQSGACRIAAGDTNSAVHVWDMPLRRLNLSPDDFDFLTLVHKASITLVHY